VKVINHFEQNRPVHLALRDVYYERAAKLLENPEHMTMQALQASNYEEILFILRTARTHGQFAVRDNVKNEKDGQFCKFINMLAGNVKAVLSMLNLKHSVEAKDGFFFSFLEVNHASVSLQAEEYERRARDIIRCMLNTLDIASSAFHELQQSNLDAFTELERERYDKAMAHYKGLIEQHPDLPKYEKRTGLFA
jgi:tetratricopeptide (TPR) repeat protein